jgi:hypothetical protein
MTPGAAAFFWQRDTYLLEGEEDFRTCEAAISYIEVKFILDGRVRNRIELTKMILRTLRVWLINTARIVLPEGDIERWLEKEYLERTVYDRLQDSNIAYLTPEKLKTMYDMGKPPYSRCITFAGIHATK